MIIGDRVVLLEYAAYPYLIGKEGEVRNFREVGLRATNIEYEYLIQFENMLRWIPSRYLRHVR